MNLWDYLIPLFVSLLAGGLCYLLRRRQRDGKFSGCAGCPYGGSCSGPSECRKEDGKGS